MTSVPTPVSSRHEIAFIDTAVIGFEGLVAALEGRMEVVLIDAGSDGLARMEAALEGRSALDAVHVFSHGAAGQFTLGQARINTNTLEQQHQAWSTIGAALAEHGDLLLYGCDVASSSAGTALLTRLAQLTGADVAASTDASGAGSGANWVLEHNEGDIAVDVTLAAQLSQSGVERLALKPIGYVSYSHYDGYLMFSSAATHLPHTYDLTKVTLTGWNGVSYTLTGTPAQSGEDAGEVVLLTDEDRATMRALFPVAGDHNAQGHWYTITSVAGWHDNADGHDLMQAQTLEVFATPSVTLNTVQFDYAAGRLILTTVGTAKLPGDANDIASTNFTIRGAGGSAYKLTSASAEVAITPTSHTTTIALNAADLLALRPLLDKVGSTSVGGSVYNVAASANWNVALFGSAFATKAMTVVNVAAPTITSASYNALTGILTVQGEHFYPFASGSDIDASKLTIGGASSPYTLTSNDVNLISSTSFSIALNAADQVALEAVVNKSGSKALDASIYNLAAANGWLRGAPPGVHADLTANPITALNAGDIEAPTITAVYLPTAGKYSLGQHLDFVVNFSESVNLSDTSSTLALTIGASARSAALHGHIGQQITYRYTITSSDLDLDGIVVGSLSLGTSVIQDPSENLAQLSFVAPDASAILVDGVAPSLSGMITAPVGASFGVGAALSFSVTFSEAVTPGGSASRLALDVGGQTRYADYVTHAGNVIEYRYTVAAGDTDSDGIGITALELNGGTLKDGAGNSADLTLAGHLPDLSAVLVDGVAPSPIALTGPAAGTFALGQALEFWLKYDEALSISGTDSRLALTIGSSTRYADFVALAGDTVHYRYTTQAGDLDGDGIAVTALELRTSVLSDAAGNVAGSDVSTLLPDLSGVVVDAVAPGLVGNLAVPAAGTYRAGDVLNFTINFDKVLAAADPALTLDLNLGGSLRSATLSAQLGSSLQFGYTVQPGDLDTDGIAIGMINLGGTRLTDLAGNPAPLALAGHLPALGGVRIDAAAPQLRSSSVDANQVILQFDDSAGLDGVNLPLPGAFILTADGSNIAVLDVVVDAASSRVVLTLASPVLGGTSVSLSYNDVSGADDVATLQDSWGNDVASFSAVAITNITPALPPAPGGGSTELQDGVPVTSAALTRTDGSAVQQITIPTIDPARQDPATITLASGADGAPWLAARMSSGVALQANLNTAQSAGPTAQASLGRELVELAGAGYPELASLTQAGNRFAQALEPERRRRGQQSATGLEFRWAGTARCTDCLVDRCPWGPVWCSHWPGGGAVRSRAGQRRDRCQSQLTQPAVMGRWCQPAHDTGRW